MSSDKAIHRDNEFYDASEEDGVGLAAAPRGTKSTKDTHSYRNTPKRPKLDDNAQGDGSQVDTEEFNVCFIFTPF